MGAHAVRSAARLGLLGGAAALLIALVGMVQAFATRAIVSGMLSMGHTLLLMTGIWAGALAARSRAGGADPRAALLRSLVAGVTWAAPLALLLLVGRSVNLRAVLANASPELYQILSLGRPVGAGVPLLVVAGAVLGLAGGLLTFLPDRVRRPLVGGVVTVLLGGLFADLLRTVLAAAVPAPTLRLVFRAGGLTVAGAAAALVLGALLTAAWTTQRAVLRERLAALPAPRRRRVRLMGLGVGLVLLLVLPFLLGSFLSYALVLVGLYVLMGLGLNLEVGWAGLLDLGFVAFFAIGAYTIAILTSPLVGWFGWTFWQALPVAVGLALVAGVVLGVPVLGIRGDYLAIATLGFGEITRLLVQSDWLRPWTGGSQGIRNVPRPAVGGFELVGPQEIYYIVLAACALVLFIAIRLRQSRLGRAWMAMREDEDVAQAMGINLVQTKLLAYGLGAGFAGIGGAVFAAMIGSVFPHSFQLLISINVLALIIVGGMGSVPGVFAGALILVGLPELLREFAEYRLLMYGALLIVMMQLRPEGFWPEAAARLELAEAAQPDVAARVPASGAVPDAAPSAAPGQSD